jgi:KUP system potassium uptake protein
VGHFNIIKTLTIFLDNIAWECLRVLAFPVLHFADADMIPYRVCVMFVTLFDTCMVSLAALIVWRLNPLLILFQSLTIACLDGVYLSSALIKVPSGAWFTLALATVLASLFMLWRFGKEQQWLAETADRFPTTYLVKVSENGRVQLTDRFGGRTLSFIEGFRIFFDKSGETTPTVFSQFLSKLIAAPHVIVFFHLRLIERPSVPPEDRYIVSQLAIPNCYRLIIRQGYMDEVISPDLGSLVFEQVRDFIIHQGTTTKPHFWIPAQTQLNSAITALQDDENEDRITIQSPTTSSDMEEKSKVTNEMIAANLAKLQQAYDHQVLYIIGKEQIKIKEGIGIWRSSLLRAFLWLRDNTRTKIANLKVNVDRVIEVGYIKQI